MFRDLFGKKKGDGKTGSESTAKVFIKTIGEKNCLYFEFQGVLDDELAKKVILEAEKLIKQHFSNNSEICIVCGCSQMQDYDPVARLHFQNFLKNHANCIHTMWVITTSRIIKYGGLLMGLVLPFSIKVVESEDQIKN